jgi:hypothetical protein
MKNTHPRYFHSSPFTAGCVMQPQIRVPVNEDTVSVMKAQKDRLAQD